MSYLRLGEPLINDMIQDQLHEDVLPRLAPAWITGVSVAANQPQNPFFCTNSMRQSKSNRSTGIILGYKFDVDL